ncbi:sensor histidine kinase [Phytoactinopolyspora halotolerans]|uniref:histidine kinase n=1 Tax=Phytoactinopolyspora halotolerans TaxID=1981512 RepID=A0A6L9SAT5_9ACTN|nr:sensor histidine kinase [Phytoactinopolyspora halotolerans]NEE02163.1 sensor histidine kinase [Phytoactinopolyspora halotolerans]
MPSKRPVSSLLVAGWVVSALGMTAAYLQWRAYVREVEERAAEAERTREEAALRRAGEERLRIARELHDSLTHNISIIKVQAGVAVHLARKNGEDVPDALLAIQDASSEAARELRSTLEVLRADDDPRTSTLDRVDELAERARAAGVPVKLEIVGNRRTVPGDVDLAAYRIIQEALTNVARHAGPSSSALVRLEYDAHGLVIRIDDDGVASVDRPSEPGVGLIGMRERVTALGGRLDTGPRDGGGFTVLAELPLGPS